MVAYDAMTGQRLWGDVLDNRSTHENAHSIGVSPDGFSVFVTGTAIFPDYNYVTIAYDADTGRRQWTEVFERYVWTEPFLAIDPTGGKVFVAGERAVGNDSDFMLLAYSAATGALRTARPGT